MVQSSNMGTATGGRAVEYVTPTDVTGAAPRLEMNTAVVTPTDRVRWGPILAGLFAALSTLALLGVLGLAVGLSAYDPGDRGRNFGIGAGVWGAISALIAFALGGWLAARTAAVGGRHNGILNGVMVWAVAIPLMLYLLAGGMSSAANTASNVAGGAMASDRTDSSGQTVVDRAASATSDMSGQATPDRREQAARAARRAAWGTLVSLILSLGAAAVGGHLGARSTRADDDRHDGRATA